MLKIYLRVLALLKAERGLAITLALLNLLLAGFFYLEPLLFGRVVDAMVARSPTQVWRYIGAWFAVGIVGVVASVWTSLHADRLAHRQRLAVITRFFDHALALPLAFHRQNHTGRLMRILQTGSGNLFMIWLGFFREHLATLLSVLVMLPFAWHLNWKLALVMTLLMFCFAVFNAVAMRRTSNAQYQVEQLHHQIAERADDVLGNVPVIQAFDSQRQEVAGIRELTQRALAAQYPVLTGWAWLSVATRAASTLTVVAIFALGARLNSTGEVSIGEIVTFVGFAMLLIGRLEQLAGFVSGLFLQTPALRDFFAILDTPGGEPETGGKPPLAVTHGEVRFEDVSFRYGAGESALEHLTFTAAPGSTVALVGATGAGKSTALSLLYRAHEPTGGRITIDGTDIRDVSLSSLRQHIAVVFQESGLLYRSIGDNLRLGDPAATQEQIEAAARAAEAHDFILVKPEGYATRVAEGGGSLSGGERQRLAIARAMLKDAPVLILDEATSALDNATETRIQKALQTLTAGRTTLIIAHRLSTVRDADQILVLHRGRLVEQGRFDELVARGGTFAELARGGQLVNTEEKDHGTDGRTAGRTGGGGGDDRDPGLHREAGRARGGGGAVRAEGPGEHGAELDRQGAEPGDQPGPGAAGGG
jgi:ATP-binding cassette subfamily B protein